MKILVTGGAGFIGSALIRYLIKNTDNDVINLDKLTYASNLSSLDDIKESGRYRFENIDICNKNRLSEVFLDYRPDVVMHLAAESHVDNSIKAPNKFLKTNIIGTFNLLESSRLMIKDLKSDNKKFIFHHISTDEVYGDLNEDDEKFSEETPYAPSSPYSASKASSDHIVRAWFRTYDLPIIITNCSNNYGPYQFPEKLIPSTILKAINGKQISIYGNGQQIRDWLFVDDHVQALYKVATEGKVGETYNIGGNCEKRNIEVVEEICSLLDEIIPLKDASYHKQIKFVSDRPGHDQRYAINSSKISNQLGWEPKETFDSGIKKTVLWYLNNHNLFNKNIKI